MGGTWGRGDGGNGGTEGRGDGGMAGRRAARRSAQRAARRGARREEGGGGMEEGKTGLLLLCSVVCRMLYIPGPLPLRERVHVFSIRFR